MIFDDRSLVSVTEILKYVQSDRFMSKREAAEYCGVSIRTIESWQGLPRYKSGKTLFQDSAAHSRRSAAIPGIVEDSFSRPVSVFPLCNPHRHAIRGTGGFATGVTSISMGRSPSCAGTSPAAELRRQSGSNSACRPFRCALT
jgi:hypothetical protein